MSGGNATSGSGGISIVILPAASEAKDEDEKKFDQDTLMVTAGASVSWINQDSVVHTVTSGSPRGGPEAGMEFDSSYLDPGKSFNHTFDKAGEFDCYCTLHPFMTGKVIVV